MVWELQEDCLNTATLRQSVYITYPIKQIIQTPYSNRNIMTAHFLFENVSYQTRFQPI